MKNKCSTCNSVYRPFLEINLNTNVGVSYTLVQRSTPSNPMEKYAYLWQCPKCRQANGIAMSEIESRVELLTGRLRSTTVERVTVLKHTFKPTL